MTELIVVMWQALYLVAAPIRLAIFLIALALFLWFGIFILGRWLIRLCSRLFAFLSGLFVDALMYPGYLIMRKRRKENKAEPMGLRSIEFAFQLIPYSFRKITKILSISKQKTKKWGRIFLNTAIIVVIILPILIGVLPNSSTSLKYLSYENWLMTKQAEYFGFTTKEVFAQEKNHNGKIFVAVLKNGYDGVNVRKEPRLGPDEEIVTSIGEGEVMIYLNEEKDGEEGRTWYKIETDSGRVGWVSSKAVKLVEQ